MVYGLLSATLFMPFVTGLVILIWSRASIRQTRITALVGALLTLVLSIVVFLLYDHQLGGPQFVERIGLSAIGGVQLQYLLGVDGLSAPLVMLTGLLGFAATLGSMGVHHKVRHYFLWLFMLQATVIGVFVALDLLLFFVFFEFEVLPMYMLISIWGSNRRHYSAIKFAIFTLAGGAFMLLGIAALIFSAGIDSLALVSIAELGIVGLPDTVGTVVLAAPALAVFIFFFIAFAVKLPIWPLHNWLPDAHTDAPTAVSVMLAGVLLKMGGYGLYRINLGLFQTTQGFTIHDAAGVLAWLAAISVIYGALVTLWQTDLKRMIAYSSISHMGFVTLGLAAISSNSTTVSVSGLTGGALQLFTHGVITGLLFLTVGMIYERVHTRHIPHMGALAPRIPIVAALFTLGGFAALGLPTLAGFVAEITTFLGTYKVWPWQTAIAAFGVVLAAAYILWANQRIFFGERPKHGVLATPVYDQLRDIKPYEAVAALVLVVPIVLVGLWPVLLADVFESGIKTLVGG